MMTRADIEQIIANANSTGESAEDALELAVDCDDDAAHDIRVACGIYDSEDEREDLIDAVCDALDIEGDE